jgi:hypothetical protein
MVHYYNYHNSGHYPSFIERERERERRKFGGGSERDYRLEGGVIET